MGRWRSSSGSGARGCAGLGARDDPRGSHVRRRGRCPGHGGASRRRRARPGSLEGTRRRLFRSRALAQVDDAPSAFTTWGPLGAFASVGETVSFEIHARARDGTLLESFDDPSAFPA